ncbi:MAG: tetratricopeptide repeat protein [Gammaproteobacteria bacterium]
MKRRWLPWLGLAVALTATALVYWPGTYGSFLLDDYPNIVDNPALKITSLAPANLIRAAESSDSGPLGRPLSMVSFALNDYFSGMKPGPMKITNVAIHLLNGVLVFLFLRLLLGAYARSRERKTGDSRRGPPLLQGEEGITSAAQGNTPSPSTGEGWGEGEKDNREQACSYSSPAPIYDWVALAVTAAWLLAPINLTAVLYVVQRMTSLAATFTLLGLIAYMAGRRLLLADTRHKTGALMLLAAALVATALAAFTKEVGALTLLYAFVIEWVIFGLRRADGRRSPLMIGYFTLFLLLPGIGAVVWLLPGALEPGAWASRSFDLGQRLLSEGSAIWHYIGWSLLPDLRQLTLYHDAFPVARNLVTPWTTLPAWAGIAILFAAGLALRRRRPLISLGILWFLAGQVMTATFIPLELVFEHREYLPSIGLYLLLFSPLLLVESRRLRVARIGAVAAIVLLYACALALRSLDWSNPLLQAAIEAQAHPESPRATYAYGRTLAMFTTVDPSVAPKARAALEAARRVPGQTTLPDSALILLEHDLHQPIRREWFEDMAKQLHRRPPNPEDIAALNSLVNCAIREDDPCRFPRLALDSVFAAALEGRAPNGYVMAIYGNYLLNARHDPAAATGIFKALVHLSPDEPAYHFNLGVSEANAGNLAAARTELATLKRLNRFGLNDPQIKGLSKLISRIAHDTTQEKQTHDDKH